MANLGNVGHNIPMPNARLTAWGFYTADKQPTSVTMSATSGVPNAFVVLTRNGVVNYRSRADNSGVWSFYDMDDSGSQTYSIATYTQDGATGEAWVATVVGSVVTITQTFSAQRASAHPFT